MEGMPPYAIALGFGLPFYVPAMFVGGAEDRPRGVSEKELARRRCRLPSGLGMLSLTGATGLVAAVLFSTRSSPHPERVTRLIVVYFDEAGFVTDLFMAGNHEPPPTLLDEMRPWLEL